MALVDGLLERLRERLDRVTEEVRDEVMTPKLQDFAQKSGWPAPLIPYLSVKYEDGHYKVDYPAEVAPLIQDQEYGVSNGRGPNPVLRKFMNRSEELAAPEINKRLR